MLLAIKSCWKSGLYFQVTQAELHSQFHALGAGVIEEVRVQRDKGFGFVRYNTHEEAALAIQMANGRIIHGKSMKVIKSLLQGLFMLMVTRFCCLLNIVLQCTCTCTRSPSGGFLCIRLVSAKRLCMCLDKNIYCFVWSCMQCSWGSKPTPPGITSNPLPPPAQPYQILPAAGMNQVYSPADLLAYRRQLALSQAAATSMALNSGGSQPMYEGYPNSSSGQQLMYYR